MQLKRLRRLFRSVTFIVVTVLVIHLAFCYYVAGTLISPKRHIPVKPREMVLWEPVKGVPAWVSPAVAKGTAKNVFIFSHGIKADRSFFAVTAGEMMKRGYDAVVLPMPGHDENPEKTVGFGTSESKLIRETIAAVKADHIVLVGTSMGGAATWMASDDPRVDGVVTESAYGRLEPITHVWFNRIMNHGDIIFKPVLWIASWKVGLNPSDINPVETAAKWDHHKPALVMHAGEDQLIPISQGEELAKVSGAEYWKVPGASHADCESCGKEYVDRIEGVMRKVLKN